MAATIANVGSCYQSYTGTTERLPRHDLHKMLTIALLSTLSGGEGCVDMELFGRAKEPFLRRFLLLGHGIPSHDVFSNLFRALDPTGLEKAMARLARGWAVRLGGDVVAVDGKALRRSFEDAASRSPLHLVQAFSTQARLVLGQVEVDGKSNEIPALPKLLDVAPSPTRAPCAARSSAPAGTTTSSSTWSEPPSKVK